MEHDLVLAARKYLDVPYVFKGRGKGGIDCAGLVIKALNDCGIEYEYLDYAFNPNPNHIKEQILSKAYEVGKLTSGDILLLKLTGLPQHVAIYTNENTIIHSYKRVGKVVEEELSIYWLNKLDSAYRMR